MSQDEISQVLAALQQQIHDLQNENTTVSYLISLDTVLIFICSVCGGHLDSSNGIVIVAARSS